MIVYIIFFIILILFSSLDFFKFNDQKRKELYNLFYVFLVLFIGLRYKLANDWYNYLNLTKQIESIPILITGKASGFSNETSIEYGFKLLVSIINTFFNSEKNQSLQVLTLIITIFNYYVLFKIVKSENTIKHKFLFISTFVGFTIFREFDILRQSTAFYIFLLSIKYIGENFKKYFIINLIGLMFHSSALIFFPLYYFFKSKRSKLMIYVLLFFHCFTMFVHFSFVSKFLEFLSAYFPELVFIQKIYTYSSELEGGNSLSLVGILYAVYLILLIINYKDVLNSSPQKNIYINAFFIFILINIIFSDSKDIADRFSYFFYFGLAYVFVLSINYLPRHFLLPYIFLILMFPFIRFTRVISEPKTKSVLVPYRNYLFVKNSEEDEILSNWQNKNEEPFQQ